MKYEYNIESQKKDKGKIEKYNILFDIINELNLKIEIYN